MILRTVKRNESGQMTIEFAAMFPVMLMIALVSFNAIMFLSESAAFDRIFRESACVYGPSPGSDQNPGQVCADIKNSLDSFQQKQNLNCTVTSRTSYDGLTTFEGVLLYTPTVFGAYPFRGAFGLNLPQVAHRVAISVDTYKPGVFL